MLLWLTSTGGYTCSENFARNFSARSTAMIMWYTFACVENSAEVESSLVTEE